MNRKQQNIYTANVNVNLMEQNVIQINGEIMINVNVSVKNLMYVKMIKFGILLCVCSGENGKCLQVLWMIQGLSLMKL